METATAVQKVACTGRNHVLRLWLPLQFPQITQRAGTFSPCFCQRHQSVPSVKMTGLQKRPLKPTEGLNSVADRAGWAVTLAPGFLASHRQTQKWNLLFRRVHANFNSHFLSKLPLPLY